MKLRIRYSKQGAVKFVGHLDMMRYFQKLMRRADLDVSYSKGFSPHQKMSFAAPLGVGMTSMGEYFDVEVDTLIPHDEIIQRLNDESVPEIAILECRLLDESEKNAMSVLEAAGYTTDCGKFSPKNIDDFMSSESIVVLKKTKKSEKEVNIRKMIYKMEVIDKKISMIVAQGGKSNLKPSLVMQALSDKSKVLLPNFVPYERTDMYLKDENDNLMSLSLCGTDKW